MRRSVLNDGSSTLTKADRTRKSKDRNREEHRSKPCKLQKGCPGRLAQGTVYKKVTQYVGGCGEGLQLRNSL